MAAKTTYTMLISNPKRPDSSPIKIVCTKKDKLGKIFAKLFKKVSAEIPKLEKGPERDSFVLAWWGDWTLTYTKSGVPKTARETDTAEELCSDADDNKFALVRALRDAGNTGHFATSWYDLTPDGQDAVNRLTDTPVADAAAVPTTGSTPARSRHLKAAIAKAKQNKANDELWWRTPGIPQTMVAGRRTTPRYAEVQNAPAATKPSSTAATMGVIRTEY